MYTSIHNPTADKLNLGWIPPHGRELEPDHRIVLDGDIFSVLAAGRGRYSRKQELTALQADIDAGNVEVVVSIDKPSSSSSSSSA